MPGRTKPKSTIQAITAVELVVVSFIAIIVIGLLRHGVELINNLAFFRGEVTQQRQVQDALYQLIKDVRNARFISELSPTDNLLKLRVYNQTLHRGAIETSPGNFEIANPSVFNPIEIGTITYQFISGPPSALRKKVEFPGQSYSKDFLLDLLIPDDPSTAEIEKIFDTFPMGSLPPYQTIQIQLRVGFGPKKRRIKTYKSAVSLRSKPVPVS